MAFLCINIPVGLEVVRRTRRDPPILILVASGRGAPPELPCVHRRRYLTLLVGLRWQDTARKTYKDDGHAQKVVLGDIHVEASFERCFGYEAMARTLITNSTLRHAAILLTLLTLTVGLQGADDTYRSPDSLHLADGTVVRGLIIKNTRGSVVIQQETDELDVPKSKIVRIIDNADSNVLYTGMNRKGQLPSWRVIANDLRTHDAIKSLVEIPATVIDVADFKNVPYKSFRVNEDVELNIYGDPENPAGVELGIYGPRSIDRKLRKLLRAYLAGFLTTREEIAALYALGLSKGKTQVGNIVLEITPANAFDAYGLGGFLSTIPGNSIRCASAMPNTKGSSDLSAKSSIGRDVLSQEGGAARMLNVPEKSEPKEVPRESF